MSRAAQGRPSRAASAGPNAMPFFPRTAATAVPAGGQTLGINWSLRQQQQVGDATKPRAPAAIQDTFRKQRRSRRPPQPVFMSESVYHQLQHRNKLLQQRLDVDDEQYGHEIPIVIHRNRFHSLFPLDDPNDASTKTFFGFPTSVYKATRTKTNDCICLLRLHGCLVANDVSSSTLEPWTRLKGHPNLVGVHEVFLCKDFGGAGDLCFIYDYYPGAVSLFSHFIQGGLDISRDLLWSIICQMISALSSVHAAGLACRIIDPKRILIPTKGNSRIRVNCCGVKDIVRFGAAPSIEESQSQDILALGLLCLYLVMKRPVNEASAASAIAFVDTQYSQEIASILHFMVLQYDSAGKRPTVYDISQAIHHRMVYELQFAYSESDGLYGDLAAEAQNGRLVRLLVKLLFINERPEFDNDPQWSEHGDRYPIKLFRDFVFHQVDSNGNPVINLAQVIHWLNKLDAGVPEKMILSSRDVSSLVLLGYDDLKRFIDAAFSELLTKKKQPQLAHNSGTIIQAASVLDSRSSNTKLNVNAPDFVLP